MNVVRELFEKIEILHPNKMHPFRRIEERFIDLSRLSAPMEAFVSFLRERDISVERVIQGSFYEEDSLNDDVFESMRSYFPVGVSQFLRHGLQGKFYKEFRSYYLLMGSDGKTIGYPYAFEEVWCLQKDELPEAFTRLMGFFDYGMKTSYDDFSRVVEKTLGDPEVESHMKEEGWTRVEDWIIDGVHVQYQLEDHFDSTGDVIRRLKVDRGIEMPQKSRIENLISEFHKR